MQKFGSSVKNVLKLIGINYFVLVVLLVSVELLGQAIYKLYTGKFILETFSPPQGWVFRAHPYQNIGLIQNAHIKRGDNSVTINSQGQRITSPIEQFAEEDKFSVVCIGGSTTFCVSVDDTQTWPYVLQSKLGPEFQVFNLGVPGHSSLEAIIQMTTQVPDLKPDLVIFYEGWNDLHNYHTGTKTPDYEWHADLIREGLLLKQTPIHKFYEVSSIFRFTRRIGSYLFPPLETIDSGALKKTPESYIDSLYVRNLKMLQTLSLYLKTETLFVPQVMNKGYLTRTSKENEDWTPTLHNEALPRLIDHINSLMLSCFEDSSEHVLSQNGMQPYTWKESDFIDEGHFSVEGNEKFATMLLPHVLALLQNADE